MLFGKKKKTRDEEDDEEALDRATDIVNSTRPENHAASVRINEVGQEQESDGGQEIGKNLAKFIIKIEIGHR